MRTDVWAPLAGPARGQPGRWLMMLAFAWATWLPLEAHAESEAPAPRRVQSSLKPLVLHLDEAFALPVERQSAPSPTSPAVPLTLTWGELRVPEQAQWWVPTWHSLGLMTAMRLSEAWLWPDPFAETRLDVIAEHYEEAYTRPPKWDSRQDFFEWDGDPWYINVVGHAALGAELYYRPRACGHSPLVALGFAAAGAAVWDYGFEASGVRPSVLDLVYTPLSGALIGEARFWGYQAAATISSRSWRAVLQTLIDPFGQIERSLGSPC